MNGSAAAKVAALLVGSTLGSGFSVMPASI
jgi:hypothetical protein